MTRLLNGLYVKNLRDRGEILLHAPGAKLGSVHWFRSVVLPKPISLVVVGYRGDLRVFRPRRSP